MSGYVLAIDQGTTSSRAIVFNDRLRVVGLGQQEFPQHFPHSGWVEHDAEDIWRSVVATVRDALADASLSAADIAGLGITNQRETTLIWDRTTGEAIHNAIVWQDRRTAATCRELAEAGHEEEVTRKTGLLLDPYFSATKIGWILDRVDGARKRAEAGELALGTIDSFLIWRLTGGATHVTDTTNACRTMLFDIGENRWDEGLCELFGVPTALLPEVRDCDADYGRTDPSLFGARIPILGVAGDQHAATLGQACFEPGMVKATYGTGCFAVLNTGEERVASENRLLSTIAYRLSGRTTYALEGSIFTAGAAVQWLRDAMGLISRADQAGRMAAASDEDQDVYLVPAFTGLGAPWWKADARAALFGMTRKTGPNEFARAALEAVGHQSADLVNAMRKDWPDAGDTILRVDGGMVACDWTMQRLADLIEAPVDRPVILETTALGAAWLAGKNAGVWPDEAGFAKLWQRERRFDPAMDAETRRAKRDGWTTAVRHVV